jgi:hypothetical protein
MADSSKPTFGPAQLPVCPLSAQNRHSPCRLRRQSGVKTSRCGYQVFEFSSQLLKFLTVTTPQLLQTAGMRFPMKYESGCPQVPHGTFASILAEIGESNCAFSLFARNANCFRSKV